MDPENLNLTSVTPMEAGLSVLPPLNRDAHGEGNHSVTLTPLVNAVPDTINSYRELWNHSFVNMGRETMDTTSEHPHRSTPYSVRPDESRRSESSNVILSRLLQEHRQQLQQLQQPEIQPLEQQQIHQIQPPLNAAHPVPVSIQLVSIPLQSLPISLQPTPSLVQQPTPHQSLSSAHSPIESIELLNERSPDSTSSLTQNALSNYIEIFGNYSKFHRCYFLAIRFKKPVVYFKFFTQQWTRNRISIPEGQVVLVSDAESRQLENTHRSLVFVEKSQESSNGVRQTQHPENVHRRMLLTLLEKYTTSQRSTKVVMHWAYAHETLFAVTSHNHFKSPEWIKSRRDGAFQALERLFKCSIQAGMSISPNLEAFCDLRFFHRNLNQPNQFKGWFHLANLFAMRMYKSRYTTRVFPVSTDFGVRLHKLMTRLQIQEKLEEEHHLPIPEEFYACEVTLETDVPVGIVFNQTNGIVDYVSPMVVSKVDRIFPDVNQVKCNHWFPLFRNTKTFRKQGLDTFVGDFQMNDRLLDSILSYLSIQVGEKFRYMHTDLSIAKTILKNK